MRLIDADNLKDRFMAAVVADAYKPSYSIAEIIIEIDHEPTVDAVPVVSKKSGFYPNADEDGMVDVSGYPFTK
jgi:hypothetical protein